ncbi:hypothetical protein [Psychromonas aquatilis]|uniref:Phage abortive infection protein n=1 Tax=Psychromonas aquatilis TaxID=2005072 RepID=A0ABU9GMB6_9GAMM
MKLPVKFIPSLIGVLVGMSLWSIAEIAFESLNNTDVKIVVAIIAAFGSLTTGVVIALVNHSRHKSRELLVQKRISERELLVQKKIGEREIDEAHRQRKVEIYNDFLELISSFMQGTNAENKKKKPSMQKVLDEFEKFQNGILLWGGPKVILAFLEYRKSSTEEDDNITVFRAIDKLYKALREDIGLSNEGLDELEMVQMYLKDPTEIEGLIKT